MTARMDKIKNIEKIPEDVRNLVEEGLLNALKRSSLGKRTIDYVQIESSLSGGKTGAAVFVARYGVGKQEKTSSYIRVIKIAPKELCESENEGYVKTHETLLDIFSQIEYYSDDEFEFEGIKFGILLYQDVGAIATSDLKGVARFVTTKVLTAESDPKLVRNFAREISLLLQKEVFLGLKKGLYGVVKRKEVNLSEYYGAKLNSPKVQQGLAELQKLDPIIPNQKTVLEYFNIVATYHEVNYIHGDLNVENVLVWENERGFLSCKLIDFGEVMPKKRDNFTPLFWDYSRLLGEMILNFMEEMMKQPNMGKSHTTSLQSVDLILSDFWSVIEAFFKNDSSKLENANPEIEYISRIYLSTFFDFINEAKSGIKDLRRAEVIKDYFYCQILFFLFFTKFDNENVYKRLFSAKLGLKLYEYINSEESLFSSLILSLEKFYFDFSSTLTKNKKTQVGPAIGTRSPFMGLSYFQEKDKEYFFGREKFIEELLKAIQEKPIIALAGASGSGKSSLVHAGLIPKIREKGYLIYKFRPGVNPYMAAVRALSPLSESSTFDSSPNPLRKGEIREKKKSNQDSDLKELVGSILKNNPTKSLFLLGDQFEELFTLCTDSRQREDLGVALIETAKEFKDRFRFFITIRSDFWTKLLEDAGFASVIGDSGDYKDLGERFFLSPMNIDELRSTIEKPLAVAKLYIQEGLTDLILTSISKEPGSLPLLEFCLDELWKKQVDYTLNYDAYKEIGEVKGALATYAEQVYSSLSVNEKEELKKIMLQLVQPGQGTEDTRRIALVEDVLSTNFINTLADKRLIVTGTNEMGKQTIEVVHEALIREWKRLKEWINADREFRVWQEKLRYAQKEWEENGSKDQNLLLRGSNLLTSIEWYKKRKLDLSKREIEYIEKSRYRIRRNKIILWSIGLFASSLIVGFGIFGTVMHFKAEQEALEAKESEEKAVAAQTQAKIEKELALEAKRLAEENEIKAEKARDQAKLEKQRAEVARRNAEKAKTIARELQTINEKKEIEINDITEKIAKGFSLKKEELLRASDLKRWSEYQGEMNWENAKKKCASLGTDWRLPKRGELQVNYGANRNILLKEWIKYGRYYWTSEEKSEGNAYYFSVDSGLIYHYLANLFDKHVRCIH